MKNSRTLTTLLAGGTLAIVGALAAQPADAAILAQYTFSGNTLASSDNNTRSDASNFGAGPGQNLRISGFRGDTIPSVAITFRNLPSTNKTEALNLGTYYNFTLTPTAGQRATFSSLQFDTNVGPVASPSEVNATGSYFARANFGSGFVDVGPTFTQTQTPPPNGNVPFVTRNIDLSGFNSSFFTAPVEFRIYEYKNGSNDTVGGLRVDNVVLQGDVAPVPELSTGLLVAMALGGMGLFAMRRKKEGLALGSAPFAV